MVTAAALVAWYTLIQPALGGPMTGDPWAALAAICQGTAAVMGSSP